MPRAALRGCLGMRSLVLVLVFAVGFSSLALAVVPAAVGAHVVLAPAMRAMLARATEAAVAAVGSSAVRASLPKVASVAGMGVGVTVSRTVSNLDLLSAAVAAGIAGASVYSILDTSRCAITSGGLVCDPTTAKVPVTDIRFGCTINGYGSGFSYGSALEACNAHGSYPRTETSGNQYCSATGGYFRLRTVTTLIPLTAQGATTYFNQQIASSVVQGSCPGQGGTQTIAAPGVFASAQQTTTQQCKLLPVAWDSERCQTPREQWQAKSVAEALQRVWDAGQSVNWPSVAQDIADSGVEIEDRVAPVSVEGPATVELPSVVTTETKADGTVIQRTTQPIANVTYQGDKITWNITNNTTTVTTVPGQAPTTETIVETVAPQPGTEVEPQEDRECGLPGTPACKIDETGTPTGQGVESGSVDAVGALELGQIGLMTTGQQAVLPWLWALELPSGACSALTFELHGRGFSLDLCNNALVSFWRSLLAWALAAWSALYVWRSVTEATGGR